MAYFYTCFIESIPIIYVLWHQVRICDTNGVTVDIREETNLHKCVFCPAGNGSKRTQI